MEDEAAIRTITKKTLQDFGYRVLTATDGADGVAVYAQNLAEIAVVLTDMMMPVMAGQTMIRALLRINPLVKVITTSGLDEHDDASRDPAACGKEFLLKPYSAATLLKSIRATLDRPSAP